MPVAPSDPGQRLSTAVTAVARRTVAPPLRQAGRALRWFNEWPWIQRPVRTARTALPGDDAYGDPLSTAGSSPMNAVARRAWALNGGRWSLLGEIGLAALQLGEWLATDAGRREPEDGLAILFTDLADFSTWALHAGDEQANELIRTVDAVVAENVEPGVPPESST